MKLSVKAIYLILLLLTPSIINATEEDRDFRVINAAHGLADNSAQIVTCTKTGRMIISTIGNINFYDGTNFSHIDTRLDFQFSLPEYHGNYHLYFDKFHHMWLKNTGTVTCVDMMKEDFVQNVDSVIQSLGYEGRVLDLFVDNGGYVWLLTEKGLYDVANKKNYEIIRDRNLQDLDVYDGKLLLFFDSGDEIGLDLKSGRVAHRTKAYEWEVGQNYLNSSILQAYNDGYFQIRNGDKGAVLLYFDAKKKEWTKLKESSYHLNNLCVENDKLYIPSEYGYWVYDIKTKQETHIEALRLVGGKSMETNCNTISFDKQGGMWIGTEKRGLLYARPKQTLFTTYTWDQPEALKYSHYMDHLEQNISEFNGKQANCMFMDSRQWSWFGTTTGLYLYRTPQSEPVVFSKKEGLLNNVIHSVVEDQDHNIWVSTSCGITCIMFEGDKPVFVNSFNQNDNVPIESFKNCKAVCLDDGMIVMQAIDHVVTFYPKDFETINKHHPVKLYPKLIRLLLNGNFVAPRQAIDGNVVIDRAITRVQDIVLNANQNTLSLTFSGLNYFRPLQTYYRVRVKGIDEDWRIFSYFNSDGVVDTQGMLHLPLVGLTPGKYEVEIQASMFPEEWEGTPFVWVIHVNQPWWKAKGAYVILVVLVMILLLINFYFYSRNTKMREKRNNLEGDVIRKVRAFVDRCDGLANEKMAPLKEELDGSEQTNTKLSPEFISVMMKLIPYVREHKNDELTMRTLSEASNMNVASLYEVVTSNLYKSPRALDRIFRLQKSLKLLSSTEKTVEEIAEECGFYTPNYFIGNFFHEYKMTPMEYRVENASN